MCGEFIKIAKVLIVTYKWRSHLIKLYKASEKFPVLVNIRCTFILHVLLRGKIFLVIVLAYHRKKIKFSHILLRAASTIWNIYASASYFRHTLTYHEALRRKVRFSDHVSVLVDKKVQKPMNDLITEWCRA